MKLFPNLINFFLWKAKTLFKSLTILPMLPKHIFMCAFAVPDPNSSQLSPFEDSIFNSSILAIQPTNSLK